MFQDLTDEMRQFVSECEKNSDRRIGLVEVSFSLVLKSPEGFSEEPAVFVPEKARAGETESSENCSLRFYFI